MSKMERIFFIDRMIQNNGKVTTKQVVNEFEISERMVRNDIMYMKDRLLSPIIYSKEKGGYYYKTPFTILSFADEKMLLTYSFLKSITNKMNYVPYASEDMLKFFSRYLSEPYRKLSNKIIYELSQYDIIDNNILNIIIKSFLNKKKCEIKYTNINNIKSERIIEPLCMINYEGSWLLIAYCYKAESIREFKLTRISKIIINNADYEQNITDETIKNFVDESYGIFIGTSKKSLIEICIRYYNKAYMMMKDQIFHKNQKRNFNTDKIRGDYVDLIFPVSAFDEVLTKVLKFGSDAEVIYPEEFRNKWLFQIKEMSRLYLKKQIL